MTSYDDVRAANNAAEAEHQQTLDALAAEKARADQQTVRADAERAAKDAVTAEYAEHMRTAHSTTPDPEPTDPWSFPDRNVDLIQQQYTTTLTQYASQVASAVGRFGDLIDGLGPRIPHNDLATSLARLDQWKAIADNNGLELHPRFMMGGYTADSVKNAMSAAYKFSGDGQPMTGVPIPRPTNGQSTSFNTVFENEYRRFFSGVFDWAVANDVHMLNLCWYGMAYSELYYGPAVQNDAAGWLSGHKRLIDIAADLQPEGVTLGWGLSGHGPFFNAGGKDMGMELAKYMKAEMPEADRVEGQGNGWGANGVWGQSSAATETQMDAYLDTGIIPGVQAIQPWAQGAYAQYTAAQAAAAIDNALRVDARHMEFYLPTLAASSAGVWQGPIEEFKAA